MAEIIMLANSQPRKDAAGICSWNCPKLDRSELLERLRYDERGLVVAIAQDFHSGEVLMVAWMDREAVEKTIDTGQVHYHSRSRDRLWRKGETSGNTQALRTLCIDCDGDALLLQVDQRGPACHTGERSCFFTKLAQGEKS